MMAEDMSSVTALNLVAGVAAISTVSHSPVSKLTHSIATAPVGFWYHMATVRFRYMAVSVLEEKRGDWVTHSSGGMA